MTGTCLCGGVAYEVKGELGPIALCHCGMCRKQSGTAFATNASVERRAFRLVRGTDLVQRYQSSPGKWRCFSRRRGSERERGGAVAAPLRPARSATGAACAAGAAKRRRRPRARAHGRANQPPGRSRSKRCLASIT